MPAPPLGFLPRPARAIPRAAPAGTPQQATVWPTPASIMRRDVWRGTTLRSGAIDPGGAAAATLPAGVQSLSPAQRRDKLRAERDAARAALAAADAALREELAAQVAALEGRTAHSGHASHPAGGNAELDNFGFIRQYSGEPYDQQGAMGVPGSLQEMGVENFLREARELLAALGFKPPVLLRGEVGSEPPALTAEVLERKAALERLTLSNQAIWDREHKREPVKSPWVIKVPYYVLCWVLDVLYDGRPIARFWLLETVARMPYFSYINMLHLYETLGWWRRSYQARKVHFAEEFNEAHHLLIMESMGGDQRWADRFVAQHAAIVYFWVLQLLWLFSPTLAYNFSELIEAHAVDTYAQFLDENEDALKALPPPRVAKQYYESPDLYLFDEFQTERPPGERRVEVASLYDVFAAIRDDEGEHVATMHAMQAQDVLERAPNTERLVVGVFLALLAAQYWVRGQAMDEAALGEAAEGFDLAAAGPLRQLVDVLNLEALLDFIVALFSVF